jgi:hypothetical protein
MMSSKSDDETLERGDVSQQEQGRIKDEADRSIKGKRTDRRDPENRGEAVEQERERIVEENGKQTKSS